MKTFLYMLTGGGPADGGRWSSDAPWPSYVERVTDDMEVMFVRAGSPVEPDNEIPLTVYRRVGVENGQAVYVFEPSILAAA